MRWQRRWKQGSSYEEWGEMKNDSTKGGRIENYRMILGQVGIHIVSGEPPNRFEMSESSSQSWRQDYRAKEKRWRSFGCCQISFEKMQIFRETLAYFSINFSGDFTRNSIDSIWAIQRKIFINSLKKECIMGNNLATSRCSYCVFSQLGKLLPCRGEMERFMIVDMLPAILQRNILLIYFHFLKNVNFSVE